MSTTTLDNRGLIAACPSCGQKNRIPFARIGANDARCGRCQTALAAPADPIEVRTDSEFDALIAGTTLPIVVDFWAPWCGPCRTVAPEIAKVAAAQAGRWLVVKVNTEALPALASRFQVRSIPLLAVFEAGREQTRNAGARPASAITEFVEDSVRGDS